MAIAGFYDRMCLAPLGFWTMAVLCYAAKFDPLLSLDCAPTLAQSKERKGSNFAIWQPWQATPAAHGIPTKRARWMGQKVGSLCLNRLQEESFLRQSVTVKASKEGRMSDLELKALDVVFHVWAVIPPRT